MKLIQRYLIAEFIPVFLVALLFFVLMLELGDLFANLWKYITNGVSLSQLLTVMVLYLPKCVSYSLPLSILFASSYTMGSLYARNELTSVFASGYPLHRFVFPLLVLGALLSLALFYFEDTVVIQTVAKKNALVKILLKQEDSLSNTNIVILSQDGRVVYTADYYQDSEQKLYSLLAIERNENGAASSVIEAPSASWNGNRWILDDSVTYAITSEGRVSVEGGLSPESLTEPPETFKKNIVLVDELSSRDAKKYIDSLRKSGLPYAEHLSSYYERFAFPLTVFIVLFVSISFGGRFRKNVILMSLLVSLSVAVAYYVTQMVSMLFAKWEYISPLAGAWFPALLFISLSVVFLRFART